MPADCIFCQIIAGSAPAQIFYRDDTLIAIQDTFPRAPVHILIIPLEHIPSAREIGPQHSALLSQMFALANRLAAEQGISQSGYRLLINTGPHAGQSVPHLHMHLIGGRHIPMRFD